MNDFLKKPLADLSEYAYQSGIDMGISKAKTFLIDAYLAKPDITAYELIKAMLNYPNKPEKHETQN